MEWDLPTDVGGVREQSVHVPGADDSVSAGTYISTCLWQGGEGRVTSETRSSEGQRPLREVRGTRRAAVGGLGGQGSGLESVLCVERA